MSDDKLVLSNELATFLGLPLGTEMARIGIDEHWERIVREHTRPAVARAKARRTPPVVFGRPVEEKNGDIVRTSKDGRFTIRTRSMAGGSGRSGYFTQHAYYLGDATKPNAKPAEYDSLSMARLSACQEVDPAYGDED